MADDSKIIFDNIHGYIPLNRVEARILATPYYQRLRWVKQLGFSFYIFPGATHTRHAHALGVLHVMDRVLKSIGKATTEQKLMDPKARDEVTQFHRIMRLAAMLHDIGTFPFSHSIELAYINHWRNQLKHRKPKYAANHETLGRHLIENTDFEGGITRILIEEGIDPKELSKIAAGESSNMLANQLMHADIDADRMDYLLRDAQHTGVKLGLYDMDFLIRNMTIIKDPKDNEYLAVKEDALHVVDSFLVSRYFWYSQVINDGTGYKFDLIAAKIHEYFLENGLTYSFDQLMDEVSQDPNEYFTFNDSYFMAKLHEYLAGRVRHPMIGELSEMLAKRIPPKQIKIEPVQPILVEGEDHRKAQVAKVLEAVSWLENEIKELGPHAWMISDIPTRDVMFTRSLPVLEKDKKSQPLWSRDSVKILTREGEPELLVSASNSLMSVLSKFRNFIPRIYVSNATYETLEKNGTLQKMRDKFQTKPAKN